MRESGGSYVCALSGLDAKYAGRSIRFETRISQSAGQVSSAWVEGDTVTLPRVRLDTPAASLANVNETVRVTYGQANLMIYQADWTALLTTLSWREVENADRYTITLTDQAHKSALVSVDMSGGQPAYHGFRSNSGGGERRLVQCKAGKHGHGPIQPDRRQHPLLQLSAEYHAAGGGRRIHAQAAQPLLDDDTRQSDAVAQRCADPSGICHRGQHEHALCSVRRCRTRIFMTQRRRQT